MRFVRIFDGEPPERGIGPGLLSGPKAITRSS